MTVLNSGLLSKTIQFESWKVGKSSKQKDLKMFFLRARVLKQGQSLLFLNSTSSSVSRGGS